MISVITPSVRKGGLDIVSLALKRQTIDEYEWLIGSPFDPQIVEAEWVKDDFEGGFWSLNRVYNKLITYAKSDLIVSWQDYTFADPDCLEKFLYHFRDEPKTLVSAVGNKYTDVYPTLGSVIWKDPRMRDDQGSYYPVFFNDVEGNLASVPKQAFYDVGGFCEDFDFGFYGMDFYGVIDRLNEFGGYDFKIDQTIKSYSLVHGRRKDWDKFNGLTDQKYEMFKRELKDKGKWVIMNYLSKNG